MLLILIGGLSYTAHPLHVSDEAVEPLIKSGQVYTQPHRSATEEATKGLPRGASSATNVGNFSTLVAIATSNSQSINDMDSRRHHHSMRGTHINMRISEDNGRYIASCCGHAMQIRRNLINANVNLHGEIRRFPPSKVQNPSLAIGSFQYMNSNSRIVRSWLFTNCRSTNTSPTALHRGRQST